MKQGKFIVVEGTDLSGKSTLVKNLNTLFLFLDTAEPYEEGACYKELKLYQEGRLDLSDYQRALMFSANRVSHNRHIVDWLNNGYDLVCDRYHWSTIVYSNMNEKFIHDTALTPDLLLYLDAPLAALQKRAAKRGNIDRYEEKLEQYLTRYRTLYYAVYHELPYLRFVAAGGTEQETYEQAAYHVKELLDSMD